MRTASSSVSGRIDSATRAPSAVCAVTQCRYWRRFPPVASLQARAWSITKRSRRHTSRGRPSAKPSSRARRSRVIRPSNSEGAEPGALVVERAQVGQRGPHGIVERDRVGLVGEIAPAPPPLPLEAEQVVVAAGQQRGAQGGHDVEVVGRVVDGPQHHEQVADRPAGVDERTGLGPEGDAGLVEGLLEEGQRGAGRDQDGDVAQPGRAPPDLSSSLTVPPFVDHPGDGRGHVAGLGRTHLVGQGALGDARGARGARRPGRRSRRGAGGHQRQSTRAASGAARRRRSGASPMSAAKVWLTQSMIGATVRKLAVSSTTPPPSAPKRSAARRNVEMSARRKR